MGPGRPAGCAGLPQANVNLSDVYLSLNEYIIRR